MKKLSQKYISFSQFFIATVFIFDIILVLLFMITRIYYAQYSNISRVQDTIIFASGSGNCARPDIISLTPADNTAGFSPSGNLAIGFSETVTQGSGMIRIYESSNPTTPQHTIDISSDLISGLGTDTVTINPSSNLNDATDYFITLDSGIVKNGVGGRSSGIGDQTTWNFTTSVGADMTPPTISSGGLNPADDATGVSISTNFVITFSEPVVAQSGVITIRRSSDDSVFESINVTSPAVSGSGTNIITLNMVADMAYSTGYYINIYATAFDDLAGNSFAGISATTTWNIVTGAGPARYWRFDDGSGALAQDWSGSGNSGTLTNGPTWSTSTNTTTTYYNPYSLRFDGINDYVNMGTSLNLANISFSVSAWVNLNATSTFRAIVSKYFSGTPRPFSLHYNNVNPGRFEFQYNLNSVSFTAGDIVQTGRWYHLVGIYNAVTQVVDLYLDGVLQTPRTGVVAITSDTRSLHIGARNDGSITNFTNGLIDDVRIYNRALSSGEVASLAGGNYVASNMGISTFMLTANIDITSLAL